MSRFFSFFLIFCNVFALFGQPQGKKINFHAEMGYHNEYLPGVERLIGNVIFTHENTIGYADSAYFYTEENRVLAFGRPVKIIMNDTVTLYGNRVRYDGNTKISTIAKNVILKDNTSTLYTDSLIYNNSSGIGYYVTGGKMISKEDTLTSKVGTCNTHTNISHFRHNVVLVNPTYTMTCDSFNYNTQTEIVYFLCKTHLVSDENDIFTHSGWYDTRNNYSLLIDSVKIINKDQELTSDTAHYDKNLGFGIVKDNVTLIDTARSFIVKGNYGEYFEKGGWTWITDSALLIMIDKENRDSLYLHADTLKMYFDSVQDPQLMLAYFHVKFFNNDFQGVCDSMSYIVIDSVGMMYYNPVLWNQENQLYGDTIRFSVLDSITTQLELLKDAFIISDMYDEVEFNQVKGKNIIGFIREKELKQVDAINNVELIYYVLDDDSLLIGINRMETNEMKMFLKNRTIEELRFYDYPDGKFWADSELPLSDRLLKEFRWLDAYRPKQIEDIFSNPIPREKTKQMEEDSKQEKD
jgi:lipopolysaccharide export system protein LptA